MSSKKLYVIIVILIIALLAAVGSAIYLGTRDTTDTSEHKTTTTQAAKYDKGTNEKSKISAEEAGKIVTDKYGGTIKEVENDDYRGKPAWEVEVRDSKEGRIEVKVDKQTGAILEKEQD